MATSNDSTFRLHISGNNLEPENFSLKELTTLLDSLNDALGHIASENHPHVKEPLQIGLSDLEKGSINLHFKSSKPAILKQCALTLALAIQECSFASLPPPAVKNVKDIVNLCKRKSCDMEFYVRERSETPMATLKHTELPDLSNLYLVGETTLYGVLNRVGGNEPRFKLTLNDGSTLSCCCTRDFAKGLVGQLYEVIGVTGEAKWHPITLKVVEFKATSLLSYAKHDLLETFNHLREMNGTAWENINPEDFVREMRGT